MGIFKRRKKSKKFRRTPALPFRKRIEHKRIHTVIKRIGSCFLVKYMNHKTGLIPVEEAIFDDETRFTIRKIGPRFRYHPGEVLVRVWWYGFDEPTVENYLELF